jgi:DNA polymerase III subunit delta'
MFYIYPWQKNNWQNITNRVSQGKVPHALLFSGQKGLVKLHFAFAFAKFLLCSNKTDNQPCGKCRSCVLWQAKTHPDFYLIEPESASAAIKIEQIREIVSQLSQTANQNIGKVVIVSPAEKLNLAASNALLKTLEEPTADVFFILVSNNHLQLLPTIRSRCQILYFAPPDPNLAKKWLQENLPETNSANFEPLMKLANHSPLMVQSNLINNELRMKILKMLSEALTKKITPLKLAETLGEYDLVEIINHVEMGLLDLIKIKLGVTDHVINYDCLDILRGIEHSLEVSQLFACLTKINKLHAAAVNSNVNKQLVLDNMSLAIYGASDNIFICQKAI